MLSIIKLVEETLLEQIDSEVALSRIKKIIDDLSEKREKTCSLNAYRLIRSLNDVELGTGSWKDFLIHLRQFILFNNNNIRISEAILSRVKQYLSEFDLLIDRQNEISVINNTPDFIDGDYLNRIYSLEDMRKNNGVIGDSILFHHTGYSQYINLEQKLAVKACLEMPAGHTILVSLPTGGGKSLLGQMSSAIEGDSGLSIVIVPTVSLAIDQEQAARNFFSGDLKDEEEMPHAYYSGISSRKKEIIFNGVKSGKIPLLYISPEAILNSQFYDLILYAAAEGKVNRLIIDETHIVIDWGASFRTEFQFMSILRRKLLKKTKGSLKTVLLSATITDRSSQILKNIFSEGENFIEVRCDALRPELIYTVKNCWNEPERKDIILQALHLLPRPIILYVYSPEKAEIWQEYLNENGFYNIATFTGNTGSVRREQILQQWRDNSLDIIIATSAFGMGVDKQDIRAVIHTFLPESINRFYQEVGRGGRDGFPALSLVCTILESDKEAAFNLIKSSVMTPEKIVKRWYSMTEKGRSRVSGDRFWLNADSTPLYLEGELTGQRSANWNEFVLLFMFRHNLITLQDISFSESNNRHKLLVKYNDVELLEDRDKLYKVVSAKRQEEWGAIKQEYRMMVDLIEKPHKKCFSEIFTEIYPAGDCCSGCPSCRKKKRNRYQDSVIIDIKNSGLLCKDTKKIGNLLITYLGPNEELLLNTDNYSRDRNYSQILFLILKKLIEQGIENFIFPHSNSDLIKKLLVELPYSNISYYSLFNFISIESGTNPYPLKGPIAFIFTEYNSDDNVKLYLWAQKYIQKDISNKAIYIGSKELKLSQDKTLLNLVNGLNISYRSFIE